MRTGKPKGTWVFVRSFCSGTFVALTVALALGGCASNDFDTSGAWFAKPIDVFGSKSAYTYSSLSDSTKEQRSVTANDLVDANGACPAAPVPTAPEAQPQPQSQPQAKNANAAEGGQVSADMASLIGGGVAIGMSECDVVSRLGRPTTINFGKNPNGYRSAVLTYGSGTRPGDYRFIAGRLTEMDRVDVPAPAPELAKKKIAKKKPAKPKAPPHTADKT
jgi:hypothetical protein